MRIRPLGRGTTIGRMRTRTALAGALTLLSIGALAPACGARTPLATLLGDTPDREATCGDGVVEGDEACDDANAQDDDDCADCEVATCGDGFVRVGFEACDDGNQDDSDDCTRRCALPTCGNGLLEAGEACDDGNQDDSDACSSRCVPARCGDGVVQADEECDGGPTNDDRPAAFIVQGELVQVVRPHLGLTDVATYYDYRSASSHMGFEAIGESHMVLYLESATGTLSLITTHGVDVDETGQSQGVGQVFQSFDGLPTGTFIAVSDDDGDVDEFQFVDTDLVHGDWGFNDNTDGGVLSGLPWPGDYVIPINTNLIQGIDTWDVVLETGERVDLDPTVEALLVVQTQRGQCRSDCTIPSCGDGILDAGEFCDDGNGTPGDGCGVDCLGP